LDVQKEQHKLHASQSSKLDIIFLEGLGIGESFYHFVTSSESAVVESGEEEATAAVMA
jgi:hypothetical protein